MYQIGVEIMTINKELYDKICKTLEAILIIEKTDRIQMFDCYDIVGDEKECLFSEQGVEILYCHWYSYVEVVGLSSVDYKKIFERYGE